MSSDPDPTITPPPDDEAPNVPVEHPRLRFSGPRWFFTGIVRVSYRGWTRVAAHLFPEDSQAERIAQALHIPLPDKLNMSWVTPNLAVGGRIRPEDIPAVARAGITHVIDTRAEHKDDEQALAKEHIKFYYLPVRDTYPLTVEQMMEGSQWADRAMKEGGRVLIHCEHGVGRSVQLTCAVLIYEGMNAQDAVHLVEEKRWQASPNHKQIVYLRAFESACDEARRASSKPSPSA
jgi:protein-tyrosine phosphatase